MLVGYGLVTGLSGSGDSSRSKATQQALANLLSQFELTVTQEEIQSRNVAIVMLSASLPPIANVGDKLDVNVSSMGDARSLAGGTLLMSPLKGPDKSIYALAQGPVSLGGYRFEANGNSAQKNHPTSALIPNGATVEVAVTANITGEDGNIVFVLREADASTAQRVAEAINATFNSVIASSVDPSKVVINPLNRIGGNGAFFSKLEAIRIRPDWQARIVINERTGTVVAGADVRISSVSISHGGIRVEVSSENSVSQPSNIGIAGGGLQTLAYSNSKLSVKEDPYDMSTRFNSSTVADLMQGLSKLRVSTRDKIAILQAIKAAGSLHADLIIQ